MRSPCLCIMCVDRIVLWCVFYVSVGISIHIACMFGKCLIGYECFICRHVFRLFRMKCMPASLNAYSLHLHIYDRCGVCARLTWLFVEVSTHSYSTDTLTRAHTH